VIEGGRGEKGERKEERERLRERLQEGGGPARQVQTYLTGKKAFISLM
jgi:hypothetical protein